MDEIFTVDLTLCSKCQIVGEDFVKFCGLLRKQELYLDTICFVSLLIFFCMASMKDAASSDLQIYDKI